MKNRPLEFLIPYALDVENISPTSAQIRMSPLERGFGHTIGNALRRVLLSYMPGYAITQVKFEQVPHEYVTNNNVEEDMLDVLLNLKQVIVMMHDKELTEISLHAKGGKNGQVITAGHIKTGPECEIINPDHVIAHLVKGGEIKATMQVEYGRGYHSADQRLNEANPKPLNTLGLDASFSPITQVSYRVETARLGTRADLDCLLIDIETNGAIEPEIALRRAATILWQHFQSVIEENPGSGRSQNMDKGAEIEPVLLLSVEDLSDKGVSMRTINALKKAGMLLIGDLVRSQPRDLLLMPNIGKNSMDEIKHCLLSMNLDLGKSIPNWPTVGASEPKV